MRKPVPWIDPYGSIALATLLLTTLGRWVFDAFSIAAEEIDLIQVAVATVAKAAIAVALTNASQQVLDALPSTFFDGIAESL